VSATDENGEELEVVFLTKTEMFALASVIAEVQNYSSNGFGISAKTMELAVKAKAKVFKAWKELS
jgi:hypothetical protein